MPHVGGEDDEDARREALVQQLSGQQSGQAAVTLQQLLMQPPAQRASNPLLRQQQSRQQLRELKRNQNQRREQSRDWTGNRETKVTNQAELAAGSVTESLFYHLVVQHQVLSSGQNHLQRLLQVIHQGVQHLNNNTCS